MATKHLIVICGPTAVGKTAITIQLARYFNCEILNADSRQIYREMKIGTAKPTPEELGQATHHFIDTHHVHQTYNAASFEKDALHLLQQIFSQQDIAILSGGSGLYIKAVCEGLDNIPEVAPETRQALMKELEDKGLPMLLQELKEKDPEFFKQADIQNPHRVIRALEVIRGTGRAYSSFRKRQPEKRMFSTIKTGLERPREELYHRINQRMEVMIEEGLFDEARKLFPLRHLNALNTVGYKEIFDYMLQKYDYQEAVRLLKRNSRRYAKRQLTWFRADTETRWFQPRQLPQIIQFIEARKGETGTPAASPEDK